MNENKYLIILKGIDKTTKISTYNKQGSIFNIVFENGYRAYKYKSEDVQIYKDHTVIAVVNMLKYGVNWMRC